MSQRGEAVMDLGPSESPGVPEWADTLVSLGSDIALVIDHDGSIHSVAIKAGFPVAGASDWLGRFWIQTLSEPTRDKGQRLLQDLTVRARPLRCEVGHLLPSGREVTVAYSVVRFGTAGRALMSGQDLSALIAFQERFVQAQQQLETMYQRRQEIALRYRLLFQAEPEPMLIVDGSTLRIVEVNPAAERLLGRSATTVGQEVSTLFVPTSRAALTALLHQSRRGLAVLQQPALLEHGLTRVQTEICAFRLLETTLLRLRIRLGESGPGLQASRAAAASICALSAS